MKSADYCPICESNEVMPHRVCRDRRRGLPGQWSFWECARCSVLFQNPLPSNAELRAFYADYSKASDVPVEPSLNSTHDSLRRLYHKFTGDVDPRDFIPAAAGDRVLDYGCGVAPYLVHFRSHGVLVSGAEITSAVVDRYRTLGFDVRQIDRPEKLPYTDSEFDIVYMMQVLEHVARPHELLREVHRVLKPGGVLYTAVPNANSLWRKVFAADWVSGWFAPFHIYAYSREPLRVLAAANGFKIIRCWASTPESWFRLNLKARLHPSQNKLDDLQSGWLDLRAVRIALAAGIRLVELFTSEHDCLVTMLQKAC